MRTSSAEIEAWGQRIMDVILKRMEEQRSMTANEIVDEVDPPQERRKEIARFTYALLTVMMEHGYLHDHNPRATS